jgi:hypothetical protein
MERLSHNLHAKLQEMCDCYLETDYRAQMAGMAAGDPEEEATKYLALAIMHAVSEKASKLSIKHKRGETKVTVKSEDGKESLPAPPAGIVGNIFALMRAITHIEEDQGETALALGLRDSQLDMQVKMEQKQEKQKLTLLFPAL